MKVNTGDSPVFSFVRYLLRTRLVHFAIRARQARYGRKPVKPERILVISIFGIGDAIMQTPVIELLRMRYPSAHLTVATRKDNREVFVHNPDVDEIIIYHLEDFWRISFKELAQTIRIMLHSKGYDLALLDVTGGTIRGKIAAILFGARYIVADGLTAPESNFLADELVSCREKLHVVERNVSILENFGGGVPSVSLNSLGPRVLYTDREEKAVEELLCRHRIKPQTLIMAIHVGSGGTLGIHKRWPIKRFLELEAGLMKIFPEGRIILFRGPGESDIDFTPFTEKGCILVEDFSLLEIAALLHRSSIFIGNDSGLAHLAASQDVPSVILFGPTDKQEVRPYGKHVSVLCHPMNCQPCWGLPEYLQACQGKVDCLEFLETEVVLKAVRNCEVSIK